MLIICGSSEAMAARYQHVTDAMRSQVATQVGQLIWDSPASGTELAAVMVSPEPPAAVLAAVERCISSHQSGTDPGAGVVAALADLRAALPTTAAPSRTSNETETETRRPSAE